MLDCGHVSNVSNERHKLFPIGCTGCFSLIAFGFAIQDTDCQTNLLDPFKALEDLGVFMWFSTSIQYAPANQECLVGLSSKDKLICRGCRLGCTSMNTSMDLGTYTIW